MWYPDMTYRTPWAGDVGTERPVRFEPLPEHAPSERPAPIVAPEPETVPA